MSSGLCGVLLCSLIHLLSVSSVRAAPPKALAEGKSGAALMKLRVEEMEARKWGLDMPHPEMKFDASVYGDGGAKRNALVILLDFPDNRGSVPPENIESLLFSVGTYSTGSMRDYYLENSYGLLDVQGQVVGWLRSEHDYSYYVDGMRGINFANGDHNARGMAEEALRLAAPLVDFSRFDNDGPDGIPSSGDDDGYIDAVLIVHAGPGSEETGEANDILSHQAYFRDDLVLDGVRAILYTTEPENGRVGVFCHEFGHTLGLPDLYDISPSAGPAVGLGNWSLMATGVWLDDGRTPAHLDAWSKATLGFVDPVVPAAGEPNVTLRPVEDKPVVYKLWTNGRPSREYFLAEFREKLGFDSELPGRGLIVYHVDESVRLQDDAAHYKVALEQADGLMQLETEPGNAGDAGDPFPGALGNTSFTPFSDPASRDYEGGDTQVWLDNITFLIPLEGGQEPMGFDLEVETEPAFLIEGISVDDPEGDGDGHIDPGEPGVVGVVVRNVGLAATGVEVDFEELSSIVEPDTSGAEIGDVDADSTFAISFGFTWRGIPGFDVISEELAFNLHITDGGIKSWDVPFSIGAASGTGLIDAFEEPWMGSWSHEPVTEGRADAWAVTTARAHSGSYSWAFTGEGGYPNNSDGALESPVVLLAPNSQLVFFYSVDAESLGSSIAWDGMRVEISNNGGPWLPLNLVGGYPFVVTEFSDTPLAGGGALSGHRDWTRAVADLSGYSGMARFRFRFSSDDTIASEGPYIDDFAVVSRSYFASFDGLRDGPGGVEVEVGVRETGGAFDGRGFNIYRAREDLAEGGGAGGRVPPGFVLLNPVPVVPDEAGAVAYLDESAKRGRAYLYIVEDLGPEGPAAPILLGPKRIYLCEGLARPILRAPYPNPFRPGGAAVATLPVGIPDPDCVEGESRVAFEVFDAAGRLIRRAAPAVLRAGVGELTWDGRNEDGDVVPSGIYFWRVRVSGRSLAAKMMVIQ